MPDLTGTTLGKYRLLERLGRGGMAEVYRAFQPNLDREVAVKVMHGYLAEDPGFVGRFKREAKAIAALRHPHIVQVYDFDVEGDVYYMVMEYIAGETLKARLERLNAAGQRMPLPEVEAIFRPLCDALDYAHAQGRIHRDIKPANIMFDGQRLVLTDFGIATIVGGTSYTAPGMMVGTPAYMSPEQCRGESGDVRSDIYSLGIVLYEMITGRLPFDADTPLAIVLKHLNDPLPLPSRVVEGLPPEVERVVLKALAKSPEDRYPSALALADAFEAALSPDQARAIAAEARPAGLPPEPALSPPEAPPEPAAGPEPRPAGGKRALAPGGRWPIWAWGSVIVAILVLVPAALVVALGGRLLGGAGPPMASAPATPEAARDEPTSFLPPSTVVAVGAPGEPQARLAAGRAAFEAGNYVLALAELGAALEADPTLAEAYYWRALVYRESWQYAEAIADLAQAIALEPDWAAPYYERGCLYLYYVSPVQPEMALADFSRAIELEPGFAAAYTARAEAVYGYREDAVGALADLDQALALDPAAAHAWQLRGAIYLYSQEYDRALADLAQAVDLAPDDVYTYWLLGLTHYLRGEYAETVARCDEALAYAPDDAEFYYARGMAYLQLGDAGQSLASFDEALARAPGHVGAHYGRGRAHVLAAQYEEAIADFTVVIADPQESYGWPFFVADSPYIDRALAYRALGATAAALGDLSALVERAPGWFLPYYYRGLLYVEMGEDEAALADFRTLLDLAPDEEWRRRAEEEIARLSPW